MESDKVEEQADLCPICGRAVISRWIPGKGCLSSEDYYLIGDYIVHSACFDRAAETALSVAKVLEEIGMADLSILETEVGVRLCKLIRECGFTTKEEIRHLVYAALKDKKTGSALEADIDQTAEMVYKISRRGLN